MTLFRNIHVTRSAYRPGRDGSPLAWLIMLGVLLVIIGIAAWQHRMRTAERRRDALRQMPVTTIAEIQQQQPEHLAWKQYGTNLVVAWFVEGKTPQSFRLSFNAAKFDEVVAALDEMSAKTGNATED